MTNLLALPQIPAGTTIDIGSAEDWLDQFYVPQAGYPAGAVQTTGNISSSSTTVSSLASMNGIVSGMLVAAIGIAAGTTIASVNVSGSSIVLSAQPTQTLNGVELTFYPPPLDLTGITFTSTLKITQTSAQALLVMSTTNGLMTNGSAGGQFGWDVKAANLPEWPAELAQVGQLSCVLGIHATDASGAIRDLCRDMGGFIPMTVNLSPDV